MPFYYSVPAYALTSNGTANTETDDLTIQTSTQQAVCRIVEVYCAVRSTTAGGGGIRVRSYATASTSGTPITPLPRNPNSPAAGATAASGPTAGTTAHDHFEVGVSQLGGMGGWVAPESDACPTMYPFASANAKGNMDFVSIFASASMVHDLSVGIKED